MILQQECYHYSMSQPKNPQPTKKNALPHPKVVSRKTSEQRARAHSSYCKHLPEVFVTE